MRPFISGFGGLAAVFMRLCVCLPLCAVLIFSARTQAGDVRVPPQTTNRDENSQSAYYWKNEPVDKGAQLLTLFCRSCEPSTRNVPLISVLRDTLGDPIPENDRVTDVWLLTYSRPGAGKQVLSAIPFFYWPLNGKSNQPNGEPVAPKAGNVEPLMDLTAPQHPVVAGIGRAILQWTTLDPLSMPVRATSRAYRANETDHERLHLAEAIAYLRAAPASAGPDALTRTQLDTVIARLELRKRLLGGLVANPRAAEIGEEANFEQVRVRNRNWELLRQCADKTGLVFEPMHLADTTNEYALLAFPLNNSSEPAGTSLDPVWKLLNIKDPWNDARVTRAGTFSYESAGVKLAPLGLYSLNYPTMPLLLVDFRDSIHLRRHELTQRSINEITSGIIGISHFTNWYYYAGADAYDFFTSRHGNAVNAAARLDCYSQFRVELALDRDLAPELREQLQHRVTSLSVNPLEDMPEREFADAAVRYEQLRSGASDDGPLVHLLDRQRRAELASDESTPKRQAFADFLHYATFGIYTRRVKQNEVEQASFARSNLFEQCQSQISYIVEPKRNQPWIELERYSRIHLGNVSMRILGISIR